MVEHSFTVDVPNSRLLNWYSPGGFEMLLMSIATPATERKPPVPNSLPLPPRWMVEVTLIAGSETMTAKAGSLATSGRCGSAG